MEWTGLNELREKYLSFFESKGHLRLKSFSLIPQNDKSLLLINSGMAPMKKFFTGEEEPPRHRVTTCQKCIRTPDLERVGHTARHGTYFEMLGNFSFGDYFKEEAITWAWEFLTECIGIPAERLFPSIYEKDDEAFDIWTKKIGLAPEKITRLRKEDNFWEHGSGPCGPCSEIYFDRGEKYGCGSPNCGPGCDCDRFMEIWNNVFSQFNNDGKGNYTELVQKNIDTGMGLERLACVMQGVDNLFEVDTVRKILDTVCGYSGKQYGDNAENDISIRVVTDHIRSATFMISDGVIPSNEGRGYVLRRILRRAARHGRLLGIKGEFLCKLCDVVIGCNAGAYPELTEKQDYIKKVIQIEEERFDATIDAGLAILASVTEKAKENGEKTISGADAFKLYDTFGFPVDLTKEIAAENGMSVDEDAFAELMKEQKERARKARANISGWSDASKTALAGLAKTEFCGYTDYSCKAKVLAIISDDSTVDEISEGECSVIFDKTVFYGEGGGQVGDTGSAYSQSVTLAVNDTKKTDGVYIHIVSVASGSLKVGDELTLEIDAKKREAIRRNHSALHLLQAALRKVLGSHVEQAGSYVDAERGRFDFSHFAPMTAEEIAKVEALVNEEIMTGTAVETIETDIETAKKNGAMALFGEKYGKVVRMVKMGDFSTELCGGTHIDEIAKLGLFKIISESSVAAGVRRIECTTGSGVLAIMKRDEELIEKTAAILKAQSRADIAKRAQAVLDEEKELKAKLEASAKNAAKADAASLVASAEKLGQFNLSVKKFENTSVDYARTVSDFIKDLDKNAVCVFAVLSDGKLTFVAGCGSDAVKAGASAGNIVKKIAAIAGGGGGGRPDSATAGGKICEKADEALAAVREALAK